MDFAEVSLCEQTCEQTDNETAEWLAQTSNAMQALYPVIRPRG